jgi:hypothetical protein
MLGRAGSILPVALAVLGVALPAAPAVAAKCRPLHDQEVIARSARAVLLGRSEPQWGYRLWGCSRRTGTRRLLATGGGDRELKSPMLRGTHVGYLDTSLDGNPSTVVSDDALRRHRRVEVGTVAAQDRVGLRMGDDGALAWRETVAPGQRLWLGRPGDTTRLADEGFDLTAMRFVGRTLRWRHGRAGRTSRPTAAGACPGGAGDGSTTTVDVIYTSITTVVCWRATGASTTFAATMSTPAIAGPWVAARTANGIEARNLLDPGAARTVPVGSIAALVIDEHGSLAWSYGSNGGHPPPSLSTPAVWVDDAAGARSYGAVPLWAWVALARDGSTLRWLDGSDNPPGTATLISSTTSGDARIKSSASGSPER